MSTPQELVWKIVPKERRERARHRAYNHGFWDDLLNGETAELPEFNRSSVYYKLAEEADKTLHTLTTAEGTKLVWLTDKEPKKQPKVVELIAEKVEDKKEKV